MGRAPTPTASDVAGIAAILRRSGRTVECAIEGESMAPAIPGGATVRIRCDGGVGASEGTVVALLLGETLTVHRLVHRGRSRHARGWIVSDGDANLTCDAPVGEAALLGEVESVRIGPGAWEDPAPPARRGASSIIAALARRSVVLGLEIHPRVARVIKGAIVVAMTPWVWMRPYPAGTTRRASVAHLDRGASR